jgi:hypothetical protein
MSLVAIVSENHELVRGIFTSVLSKVTMESTTIPNIETSSVIGSHFVSSSRYLLGNDCLLSHLMDLGHRCSGKRSTLMEKSTNHRESLP